MTRRSRGMISLVLFKSTSPNSKSSLLERFESLNKKLFTKFKF